MSRLIDPPPPLARAARLATLGAILVAAAAGWIWLAAVTAAMLPATDMATLGPGMAVLNHFNGLAGLPEEARRALAAACLPGAGHFGMPGEGRWGLTDLALVFLMWEAMVLAMMLPSAAPVLTGEAARAGVPGRVPALITGYLAVWTAFSLAATLAQWALTSARLVTPAMAPASLVLAGVTLVAVGLYQFTPLKYGCLQRCRVPAPLFLTPETPVAGWFRAGLIAGRDCLGCCWALMAAMFAVGVMNVVWVALLGLLMVAEKRASGLWLTRLIGSVLILWGGALIFASPAGRTLLGL